MELRQLEYFVAVAEEANFTRAAERVHISQSGVSAQIRQLEHELGAELFDRSARVTTLTTAGKAALEHARASLAAAEFVVQAVGEVSNLIRGEVVIGMVTGCTITPLFDALADFHRAHPGVEITLLEDSSDRLVDGVRAGRIDLALIGASTVTPADLDGLTIISERLVAAVPVGHPLATRRRVKLADVSAHPVICMPTGTGIRAVFDQSCVAAGCTPRVALQASAADAIADLAARGLGVAILSASMAARYTDRLTVTPIVDATIPGLLAFVWAKDSKSPALAELLRHTRAAFAVASDVPTT
jgi:DNA-binding transcriptional LysR family regulator